MAQYVFVILKYKFPLERILQTIDKHRAYLVTLHAAGKLLASGPFEPRTGGGLLVRVQDDAELASIIANDPFSLEGLADYTPMVWAPTIGRAGLDSLPSYQ